MLYVVPYVNFYLNLLSLLFFNRVHNNLNIMFLYRVTVQPSSNWKTVPHSKLPEWLKDNEFLVNGHRPILPTMSLCFRSIFRIHTETGNIWTHLLGFLGLSIFAIYCFTTLLSQKTWQEQAVFG